MYDFMELSLGLFLPNYKIPTSQNELSDVFIFHVLL